MKKLLIAAIAGLVLLGAAPQPAAAFLGGAESSFFSKKSFFYKKKFYHHKKVSQPQRLLGNSKVSWVPKYIFAGTACSALVLVVEAAYIGRTERRELTQKEAWTTIGNCFLPIIGGHIMGSLAQQP